MEPPTRELFQETADKASVLEPTCNFRFFQDGEQALEGLIINSCPLHCYDYKDVNYIEIDGKGEDSITALSICRLFARTASYYVDHDAPETVVLEDLVKATNEYSHEYDSENDCMFAIPNRYIYGIEGEGEGNIKVNAIIYVWKKIPNIIRLGEISGWLIPFVDAHQIHVDSNGEVIGTNLHENAIDEITDSIKTTVKWFTKQIKEAEVSNG